MVCFTGTSPCVTLSLSASSLPLPAYLSAGQLRALMLASCFWHSCPVYVRTTAFTAKLALKHKPLETSGWCFSAAQQRSGFLQLFATFCFYLAYYVSLHVYYSSLLFTMFCYLVYYSFTAFCSRKLEKVRESSRRFENVRER